MKSNSVNTIALTNIFFGFFPISFILGNLFINLNILIFCCLGIFHLKSKIIKIKFNNSIKIILLFFLAIFFSTILSFFKSIYLQEYEYSDLIRLVKSILFFRFFLIIVIAYLLSEFDLLSFKYFFITATLAPLLVSVDIIYQYNFGSNLIGLKSLGIYNSSFFGDELVAGSFVKNFSFFSILFIVFSLKHKNNLKFALTVLAICIFGAGILLSGNRMPLILYIFGLLLILLFKVEFKKTIFTSLFLLYVIFAFIFSNDEQIRNKYMSYYGNSKHIVLSMLKKPTKEIQKDEILKEEKNDPATPEPLDVIQYPWEKFTNLPNWKEGQDLHDDFEFLWVLQNEIDSHTKIYLTALDTWKKNKVFGNGIKSFREDCQKLLIYKRDRLCSNHPHNYYLEILTDTGIIGFSIIFLIAAMFTFFIYKNFRFLNENHFGSSILLIAVISLFLESFPIRSTGSIFTTGNASYLVLLASILVSHKKLLNNFRTDQII